MNFFFLIQKYLTSYGLPCFLFIPRTLALTLPLKERKPPPVVCSIISTLGSIDHPHDKQQQSWGIRAGGETGALGQDDFSPSLMGRTPRAHAPSA